MFGHYFTGGVFCQDLNLRQILSAYNMSRYEPVLLWVVRGKGRMAGWNPVNKGCFERRLTRGGLKQSQEMVRRQTGPSSLLWSDIQNNFRKLLTFKAILQTEYTKHIWR